MRGTDLVRHCGECRKSVYNLSAMTREEAEALIRAKEGRLCVQFYRRADGTVATWTCTRAARFARRTAAAAVVIFGGLLLFFRADSRGSGPPWYEMYQPFRAVVDWFTPASSYKLTRGDGCLPPTPTPIPPAKSAPAPRER